ncbi:hypothetical protein VTK26DRAFT_6502 [Humicola hyalothermophila]
MKGRPIDQLVYEYMFPKPRQSDPQNFQALLQRYLILEVRQETHSFYGHIDTPEAKYPGLDYTHPIHRIRLSRWPWHRRLFRAFDGLRLTHAEISGLTKWEGTKWAKERFEREQGIQIRDTAADGLPNYADPDDPHSAQSLARLAARVEETDSREEPAQEHAEDEDDDNEGEEEEDEEEEEEEESEGELESVGVSLNERLRERVTMRNMSGDNSMPLDEEWENWLKSAIESGELPYVADQIARFPRPYNTLTADDIFPRSMMAAARAGRWDEIPTFLHDMIRHSLESSARRLAQTSAAAANTSTSARPSVRYSNVLGTISRAGLYVPDPPASHSEFRSPESSGSGGGGGGHHASQPSSSRVQQTAQRGA